MMGGRLLNYGYVLILLVSFSKTGQADYEIEYVHTFLNPSILPTADEDLFGYGNAWANGAIFISAREADVGASNAGVLYQYQYPSGEYIRTIENPTPEANDSFGSFLKIIGDTVWVGTQLDNTLGTDAGVVYVYDIESGSPINTIYSPNPTVGGRFGFPILEDGEDVLVGAIGDSVDDIASGAVYRVDPETGAVLQTYTNPSPATGDWFGFGIDTLDCEVLISSRFDVDDGTGEGTAYLFDIDGNLLNSFPNPSSGVNEGYFAVALLNDKVVVGAVDNDDMAVNSGVVRVFDKTTGDLLRSIYHPDNTANARFGILTHLGTDLIVGAPASSGGFVAGGAFVVSPETGDFLGEFFNPNSVVRDNFGQPVTVDGEHVLISAWDSSPTGIHSGAAYLFSATTDEEFIPIDLPPSAPVVRISPGTPDTLDDLTCVIDVDSIDPECAFVTYTFEWYRNGALVAGATDSIIPSSDTAWGDFFQCVVIPNDGEIDGPPGVTDVVIVGNSAERPTAVENWALYNWSPAR
jgi:hypothetical protein